ncbi:MAG: ribosome maturation factor RimM [Buchnera aphidicola (Chaetogeoica yunlongensis)]
MITRKSYLYKNNLIIAKFGAPYGILGWIHVFSYTQQKEKIFSYIPWMIQHKENIKILSPENWKTAKKTFIVKIKNFTTRCMAKTLTNCNIFINESKLPKLKKNNYYWKDIINCTVFTNNFNQLGKIINLITTLTHDVLVIKTTEENNLNQHDILIPFIYPNIIKEVNICKKKIIVNWKKNF